MSDVYTYYTYIRQHTWEKSGISIKLVCKYTSLSGKTKTTPRWPPRARAIISHIYALNRKDNVVYIYIKTAKNYTLVWIITVKEIIAQSVSRKFSRLLYSIFPRYIISSGLARGDTNFVILYTIIIISQRDKYTSAALMLNLDKVELFLIHRSNKSPRDTARRIYQFIYIFNGTKPLLLPSFPVDDSLSLAAELHVVSANLITKSDRTLDLLYDSTCFTSTTTSPPPACARRLSEVNKTSAPSVQTTAAMQTSAAKLGQSDSVCVYKVFFFNIQCFIYCYATKYYARWRLTSFYDVESRV